MNGDPVRISAKKLGKLALPDCCERCFWIQLRMGFKLPCQVFPGIFSSLDSYQKQCIHKFYDQHQRLPDWMAALGNPVRPVKVPHHSQFQYVDPDTGILLTGTPDDIFERGDGKLLIIDYKTAKHSDGQDALFPMYMIQLNAYRHIAQMLGMGEASALYLVYFEPLTEVQDVDAKMLQSGFSLDFRASVVTVEMTPQIPFFLRHARQIADLGTAPPPEAGCKDCILVERMFGHLPDKVYHSSHDTVPL